MNNLDVEVRLMILMRIMSIRALRSMEPAETKILVEQRCGIILYRYCVL
jgi:hypothetical protein